MKGKERKWGVSQRRGGTYELVLLCLQTIHSGPVYLNLCVRAFHANCGRLHWWRVWRAYVAIHDHMVTWSHGHMVTWSILHLGHPFRETTKIEIGNLHLMVSTPKSEPELLRLSLAHRKPWHIVCSTLESPD